MDAVIRTPVTELLDRLNIPYRLLYHAEPVYTVEAAARQRGVVMEEMVKSILLRDSSGRYVMACVPGACRVDLRKVRAMLGTDWRRLYFASDEEILVVTRCPRGAVTPLALPAEVPVIFDKAIAATATVNIASGDVMAGLELASSDLIRVASGRLGRIAEDG